MTQRLVLIPWEEYQTLKGNLTGGGAKQEPEITLTEADKDETIPQTKETDRVHNNEEDNIQIKLPDTSPPGILARGWLSWK